MGSLGRGHFEVCERQGLGWLLSGWALNPDTPASVIHLARDGAMVAEVGPEGREDVGRAFPWIAHAEASGFHFAIEPTGRRCRLDVVALGAGREVVRLRTSLFPDLDGLRLPPANLIARVIGSPDPRFFVADGVRSFTEFSEAIGRYRPLGSIRRMLDWGCGPGRLAMFFQKDGSVPEVYGCDIDAEAVHWCQRSFSAERFSIVDPLPPTAYQDGFFDLVIGYSVFTHLDSTTQLAWLEEMRRLLAPRGLFLASVHGEFAARFAFPDPPGGAGARPSGEEGVPSLLAGGFFDAGEDHALDGIAPPGYYRGVFQTAAWTRQHWSSCFEVLEIIPGGMQNYQDLVILRRR